MYPLVKYQLIFSCLFLQILPEFNFLLSRFYNKDFYIIISQ